MARWLCNIALVWCFFLGVLVCVLAVRARTGSDVAAWTYYRYLPDRSVHSNGVHLGSDRQGVSLDISWGHVAPFNGQLVWGYHVNADNSGGRPQLDIRSEPYDPLTRWFMDNTEKGRSAPPLLSWVSTRRTKEVEGDDFYNLHIGISHWLLALLLFVPPLVKLNRFRKAYLVARPSPTAPEGVSTSAAAAPTAGQGMS